MNDGWEILGAPWFSCKKHGQEGYSTNGCPLCEFPVGSIDYAGAAVGQLECILHADVNFDEVGRTVMWSRLMLCAMSALPLPK